ncbi:NAD nucleotidase [Candidatus Albibeggiatoa sp. nov. NOAA]|uniref:NAD nucleotidase n=1 Tax=Candidatus Albibeggiatoa sp. nov. NOAA TaxID=3162724 RepID=UPI0033045F7A|nr:NAD nucleotidase [Thiotrichaceae bacterium]
MRKQLFYPLLLLLLTGFASSVHADDHCENNKCTYDVNLEKSGFYILGTSLNSEVSNDTYTTNIDNAPNTASTTSIGIGVIAEANFQPVLTFTLPERAAVTIESTEFTEQVDTFPLFIASDETGDTVYQGEMLGTDELTTPVLDEGTYSLSIASTEGVFIIYVSAEGLSPQSSFDVTLNTENPVAYLAATLEAGDVQFSTNFGQVAPEFAVFYQEADGNLTPVFSSADDATNEIPDNSSDEVAELPNLVIENDIELASVDFDGGVSGLNLTIGLGSGAFRGNEPNTFYTVTDRGPNIPCDDTADIVGIAEFCRNTDGSIDEDGKVFPVPTFTPSIYKFQLVKNPDGGVGTQQVERILLKNSSGTPITGLSNPLEVMTTEGSFSNAGDFVAYDVEGLDTEALIQLSNGTFWLAEEYAPSLIHVAADGTILERVVPAGVEGDLSAADYPVTGKLPAILQKRPLNRGVESIAVSPDEQFLYFIMQSPLSNPDTAAYKASRNVRLFKLGLENGEITNMVAEYAYMIDDVADFPLDNKTSQNSVKISEMLALDTDVLVILERVTKQTKLFIVDLSTGQNILGTEWDDVATTPSFELSDVNALALEKQDLFDSALHLPNLSSKVEGIALLDNYIVLINDNDFGIAGAKTEVTLIPLVEDADASLQPPVTGDTTFSMTVLHVNDHHSHLDEENYDIEFNGVETRVKLGGFPRMTARLKQLRNQVVNPLVLHAGDAMNGTLFYTLFKGEADVTLMNQVNFDAMALGNHEFDDGDANLANFVAQAEFPILAANIDFTASPDLRDVDIKPYIIKDVAGEKVAIVGLDTTDTPNRSSPSDGVIFSDEIETAKQVVADLEAQGIDKIVLLTHQGYGKDMDLAKQVAGVDVIVGGDSHSFLGDFRDIGLDSDGTYPTRLTTPRNEPVCVVQAWHYSYAVGSLQVDFDENGIVTNCFGDATLLLGDTFQQRNVDGDRVPVSAEVEAAIVAQINSNPRLAIVEPDVQASATLESYQDQVETLSSEVIGQASEDLLHARIPTNELPNGSYIAPVVSEAFFYMLEKNNYQPDLVLQNAGGVRIDVPAGDISIGTAYTLLPFSNTLYVLDMTGAEIKQVIEDAVANFADNGGSSGSFPYGARISYTIDMNQPINQRVSNVQVQDDNGQFAPINPNQTYRVGTNSFIASGRDGYTTFGNVLEQRGGIDTYFDYAESFVNYVREVGTINKPASTGVTFIAKGDSATGQFALSFLGRYDTGVSDESAAEIVSYDPTLKRLFVVNANQVAVEVLDITNPAQPTQIGMLNASALGGVANSVSVKNGIVAIAVEADVKQDAGKVVFFDANTLNLLATAPAGALPDMVKFTPDGRKVIVANEGEPNDDYTVDPEGSITIIDVFGQLSTADAFGEPTTLGSVQLNFNAFDARQAELQSEGVRIFGLNANVSRDLEPEYIAVSADSKTAFVSLQENNALAIVDIESQTIFDVAGFGFKDYSLPENAIDTSDKDDAVNIRPVPVKGMYQPDSIAAYTAADGQTYVVTANEGDGRDYDGFSEEARIADIVLDPAVFPNAADLQQDSNLGRLKITTTLGDTDGDGEFEELYAYGGRSFSIWNAQGQLVFDSANQISLVTSQLLGLDFNDEDSRSDDKGAEPEALTVGTINGTTYAFVGLERTNGIMVYDITSPQAVEFLTYERNDIDIGPEGMVFISADDSPNGQPLLVVASEISGTTTVYQANVE